MLAKETAIRKNKIETACMYWRGKYDIAIQNMQYDSAAVYVKNLADVETFNSQNVLYVQNFSMNKIVLRKLKNIISRY